MAPCKANAQFMATLKVASLLWIAVQVAVLGGAQGQFQDGRATFYTAIHHGSCEFGQVDPNQGLGLNVAAIPDTHPDYRQSREHCGTCYEVACNPVDFTDRYGERLMRSGSDVCKDPNASVVVRVIDHCPCSNNQRWCCGDMVHFDLSKTAFLQLAEERWGVIGLRYRKVSCDHVTNNTTPTQTLERALPAGSTRTQPVSTSRARGKPVARRSKANREEVEHQKMRSTSVYEGGFSSKFIDGGLVPYKPQNGDGFGGRPAWCSILSAKRGVSILGKPESFRRGVQLVFWVKLTNGVPDISVALASNKRILNSIRLQEVEMLSEDYSSNLGLYTIKINDILDNGQPFGRRGSRQASKVDSIVFVNNLSWNQGICIDGVKIMHSL